MRSRLSVHACLLTQPFKKPLLDHWGTEDRTLRFTYVNFIPIFVMRRLFQEAGCRRSAPWTAAIVAVVGSPFMQGGLSVGCTPPTEGRLQLRDGYSEKDEVVTRASSSQVIRLAADARCPSESLDTVRSGQI